VRVLVDTSVWVDYLRGRGADLRRRLDLLIDEDRVALAVPVRVEILSGAGREAARLARLLDVIPTYHPDAATWRTVEEWAVMASSRGHRFGVGDLLIGAIASQNLLHVWSLDDDFERMASLGLVRTFHPR
jgi:predicted nucleic acid-binding protein